MIHNDGKFVPKLFKLLPKKSFYKIIVVDDGSTDNSVEIVKKLGLKVYSHSHLGYGGNLKYGLKKALKLGADYMVEIHGDGQYEISKISEKVKIMQEKGLDLLSGSRFITPNQALKDGMPLHRFIANVILSHLDRLIIGVPLTDFNDGFRIYSKKLVKTLPLDKMSNEFYFSLEIIIQCLNHNLKIGEVPVRCYYNKPHTSVNFVQSFLFVIWNFFILLKIYLKNLLNHR